MDVEITKMNGDSFRLSEYGVTVRDFDVGSVPVTGIYGTVEGRSGTIDYGADYGQRSISVPFYTKANDFADYPLLRDKLFEIVVSREPIYVREMRRVTYGSVYGIGSDDDGDRFVGGKRYKVRISGTFDIDQQFLYGFGELAFETVETPFAESIGTSMDVHNGGITTDPALWGFGMGLIADDESFLYSHTGQTFRIYNAGNVDVHPFEQMLKITISNVSGSRNSFELRNITNGSKFIVTEGVTSAQTIVIDGANVTSNGLQYLRKTKRNFIELNTGWNVFAVIGARGAEVSYDFRFYYL